MNFERLTKSHFGRDFTVAVTDPLTILPEKFRSISRRLFRWKWPADALDVKAQSSGGHPRGDCESLRRLTYR